MDSECETVASVVCEQPEKPPSPATPTMDGDIVSNKQKRHLVSSRSEDNKLKIRAVEGLSEDSSMAEVSTDSGSASEACHSDSEEVDNSSTPKKEDHDKCGPTPKRRKLELDLCELRIPMEHGWRRETLISGVSRTGTVKGDVSYFSPCGRRFRQYPDVVRYLEKNNVNDLSRENFSFSPKVVLGEFLQPTGGEEPVRLSEEQVAKRLEDLRTCKAKSHTSNAHKLEAARIAQEQKLQQQLEKEKAAMMAKEARRVAKEEAARQKEHVRLMKEQERNERQEAIRKERELRNQQLMEARRKRQEELEKQRQEEQLRKQQERELKRQQAALIKEQAVQLYMQELNKQREMLYTVELERERRRQHMMLVKVLDSRKRLEERERKRQEMRAEKLATKERRIEQRRIELELVKELRKPVEDMELAADHKPLPTLNRIPGLKLSGQAFADTLMVFEFLHNFGETLGFDMDSLPTLNSLQMALLSDEESEEELLSVMTHLLVCAIEDPGIPNPARHTTILGQSLKQADITHANLSEILRIYLYANATGEVKALTGLHFERDREKKSDHHNNFGDTSAPCGKNAAFFEHLHENQTWKMSEWLNEKPFLALNPTNKAAILAFLCNELLQNKAVIRQIDNSIETVGQLRKDRWLMDTKLRKLRMLHNRKIRQPILQPMKLDNLMCEESSEMGVGVLGLEKVKEGDDADEDEAEDEEAESGNESDGTQPEEEEDRNLSAEELHRKIDRLSRQCDNSLHSLSTSSQQLRAICFGQDRFWRRYWSLPCAGGVFVEAMESAEPQVFRVESVAVARPEPCESRLKVEEGESMGAEENDEDCRPVSDSEYEERSCEKTEVAGEESDGDETRNEHRKMRTREKERGEADEDEAAQEDDPESVELGCMGHSPVSEGTAGRKNCIEVKTEPETEMEAKEGSRSAGQVDVFSRECAAGERTAVVKDEGCGNVLRTSSDHSLSFLLDKKVEDTKFVDNNCVATVKSEHKEDSLSAVKVEIKSDLFSAELNARSMEDKYVDCREKTLVFTGKTQLEEVENKLPTAFLVHKPIQFERLGECMEKANTVELGSVIIPNGDKFNTLSHVCSASIFNNGKELNGGFLLGSMANMTPTERNWFSIIPRDSCDIMSLTSASTARLLEGVPGLELRIPVFPPPSRLSSPSPASSQCESPAPLVLTAEEMVQLEQLKKTGPSQEPAQAKPVPRELQRGWWRITDEDQLRTIMCHLHTRGVRERELKRIMSKHVDNSAVKVCLAGDKTATDLAITPMDSKVSQLPGGAPLVDSDSSWFSDVALRVDLAILEQVESLEDKVANASMQVKGWKVPGRVTTEEGIAFRPSCMPCSGDDDIRLDPVSVAQDRLMSLEAAIERRYLKPPLGVSTGDVNLSGMSGECAPVDEVPKGLVVWREAVGRAHTSAQIAMALYMLEASIAWDKSIMKAVSSLSSASGKGSSNCQFCHSGDNEDKLLLCDGCDKGYHTYCFRPKMDNIPDGDWYCFECMNKATGERNCIVCGKKSGKNLVTCDLCPRAYHTDCLQPSLSKVPRGKWFCPTCHSKQPRKRNSGRRSTSHSKSHRESESSDLALSTPPATPGGCPAADDATSLTSAPSPPSTPGKKERERTKKLAKDLNPCRIVLEDLESHDEAWPFLLPVNTKQFPTYRKIIKNPMDLSTIKRKLQDCMYKSREEFCTDVRLIFNNCETFNEDDSPVGKAGHNMRLFFETRWNEVNGTNPKPATPP